MSHTGRAPRKAALALLHSVLSEGWLLSEPEGATSPPSPLSRLAPPDAARALRLARETLRRMDRADRLLGCYLRRMPPPPVMNILRLSVIEICQLGEAAHGVVNDAVALTRGVRMSGHLAGLVNATLRQVAEHGPDLWQTLPAARLPKWLRKPLISAYGKACVVAMEAAHANGAPLDLTPGDGDAATLAARLGGIALPNGSVRLPTPGRVSALPGYAEGDWWVQDAAAAMPVALLAPRPGEQILDLCAAPGGKTMQLAAAGACVTALDRSEKRLRRVSRNLTRTGLSAKATAGDALEHEGSYDAILLDAPCSATGTIRRHPDLPHVKAADGLAALFSLQARLFDHAVTLLRPGGRMVFCTCSLLSGEGEAQVERALSRHASLGVEDTRPGWTEPDWATPEGGLRLRPDFWPERGGMDGFYMARLRKE